MGEGAGASFLGRGRDRFDVDVEFAARLKLDTKLLVHIAEVLQPLVADRRPRHEPERKFFLFQDQVHRDSLRRLLPKDARILTGGGLDRPPWEVAASNWMRTIGALLERSSNGYAFGFGG